MLHCQPTDWFPPTQLELPCACSNCRQMKPIKSGFVHLAHFYGDNNGTIAHGNRWFCSPKCFLDFENPSYMGHG